MNHASVDRRLAPCTVVQRRRWLAHSAMSAAFLHSAIGHHEDAVCVLDQMDLDARRRPTLRTAKCTCLFTRADRARHRSPRASSPQRTCWSGSRTPSPWPQSPFRPSRPCIIGTRGIALLHGDSLDEAEIQLEKALALGATQLAQARSDQIPEPEPRNVSSDHLRPALGPAPGHHRIRRICLATCL